MMLRNTALRFYSTAASSRKLPYMGNQFASQDQILNYLTQYDEEQALQKQKQLQLKLLQQLQQMAEQVKTYTIFKQNHHLQMNAYQQIVSYQYQKSATNYSNDWVKEFVETYNTARQQLHTAKWNWVSQFPLQQQFFDYESKLKKDESATTQQEEMMKKTLVNNMETSNWKLSPDDLDLRFFDGWEIFQEPFIVDSIKEVVQKREEEPQGTPSEGYTERPSLFSEEQVQQKRQLVEEYVAKLSKRANRIHEIKEPLINYFLQHIIN